MPGVTQGGTVAATRTASLDPSFRREEREEGRRKVGLGSLALLPLLAACGFTPLYAQTGVGPSLQSVAIETPDHSRTAYFLRQQLDDELGRDRGAAPLYRLSLTVAENRFPLGVRINNVASRYEVDLTVTWRLLEEGTGKQLTAGVTPVRISYASADPPYAGVAAQQDGIERASREAAVRMRQEVARWLAAHPRTAEAASQGAAG